MTQQRTALTFRDGWLKKTNGSELALFLIEYFKLRYALFTSENGASNCAVAPHKTHILVNVRI